MLLYSESYDGYANSYAAAIHSYPLGPSDWGKAGAGLNLSGGRFGGGCLQQTVSTGAGNGYLLKQPPSSNVIRVAFWLYVNSSAPTVTGNRPIFRLDNFALTRFFRVMMTTGGLTFSYYDDVATPAALVTVAGMNDAAWHHIEIELRAHTSTGTLNVWIDGVLDSGSVASGDTSNAVSGDVTSFEALRVCGASANGGSVDIRVDDLLVWDDNTSDGFYGHLPSPHRIYTSYPTMNGSQNDGTPSAGSSYQCVDEVSYDATANADDADYVQQDVNDIDYFITGTLGYSPASIYGVVVETMARGTMSSDAQLRCKAKVGSTIVNGDDHYLNSNGYTPCWVMLGANPDTTVSWEKAEVEAMEFGFERTG